MTEPQGPMQTEARGADVLAFVPKPNAPPSNATKRRAPCLERLRHEPSFHGCFTPVSPLGKLLPSETTLKYLLTPPMARATSARALAEQQEPAS